MAEGYINLAPLYDAIRGVSRQVDTVNSNVAIVNQNVEAVRRQTMEEINKL